MLFRAVGQNKFCTPDSSTNFKKLLVKIYFVLTLITCLGALPLPGQVFKSREAALQEVFADADTVLRETLFLEDAQVAAIQEKSKTPLNSAIIIYYLGLKEGQPLRYAFFDDPVVRTKKAVVMVVVSPAHTIERIEVLAFYEPQDYLPIPKWFDLFKGRSLDGQLLPGKGIPAVTGATLSVRAFTGLARRALAIQELVGKEY